MRKHFTLLMLSLFTVLAALAQGTRNTEEQKKASSANRELRIDTASIKPWKASDKRNTVVDIGSFAGISWGAGPLEGGSPCSYYQTLYFQGEINVSGKRIKSISWYHSGWRNWEEKVEIYLGLTDSTRLYNWVPVEQLQRVFSGTIQTTAPEGWLTVELTHPFEYNNEQNLIVAVADNQTNDNVPWETYFWQTATSADGNIFTGPKLQVGIGLSGPVTAQYIDWPLQGAMGLRPDIRFEFEDVPQKAMLLYKPEVADYIYYRDFGSQATDLTHAEYFYFENIGHKTITIDSLKFSHPAYSSADRNITIAPGNNYTFTVNCKWNQVIELHASMQLVTKEEFEGDSLVQLWASIYPRGTLYEGWEMKPENFPPLDWEVTGIDAPEDWYIYSDWYVNPANYYDHWAYERMGLLQTIGYTEFGRDTLITPMLDIKQGDSLTLVAYNKPYSSGSLPIYYTGDKKTYHYLTKIDFKGWDSENKDLRAKWTHYAIDLSSIPGQYHLCFVEQENTIPHLDLIKGPTLATPKTNLRVTGIKMPAAVKAGTENNFEVSVYNFGKTKIDNYSVRLMKAGEVPTELISVNASPIHSYEKQIITLPWNPSKAGKDRVYAEVVFSGDENPLDDKSAEQEVTVLSNTSVVKELCDNKTEKNIYPLNFNWHSNLSEGIYYADELNMGTSLITEMQLKYWMDGNVEDCRIQVWIGETDKTNLAEGWISSDDLTLVYDEDSLVFANGDGMFRIPFTKAYQYKGKNLVFMINRTQANSYHSGHSQFYVSKNPAHSSRSRSYYDRNAIIDPANPKDASDVGSMGDDDYINFLWDFYADATFFFEAEGLGEIRGKVTLGDGTPVQDVKVKVNNSYFNTLTDALGNYSLANMDAGDISISATKFGYNDVEANVTVVADYYQIMDFKIAERAKHSLSGTITDHNGQALTGAKIVVSGYDNYDMTTGNDGSFNLSIWENSSYLLKVKAYGYNDTLILLNMATADIDLGKVMMDEIEAFPDRVKAQANDSTAVISWSIPLPALAKDFRYDSGEPAGRIGFNGSDLSQMGTVFRNKALVTSLSFYIDQLMTDDEVVVYVYGLNKLGKPDPNNVLYRSERFQISKSEWNTHIPNVAIMAENGFYVGINCRGYLALGTAENTSAYPFRTETHYHTWSIQHQYMPYYFIPSEYDGNRKNLMIRANGFDYGALSYEFSSKGSARNWYKGESMIKVEDFAAKTETSPMLPLDFKNVERSLVSYNVYRTTKANVNAPKYWQLLAKDISDTTFIDSEWKNLTKGEYYYAVEAVYDSGKLSYSRKSEKVGKDMEAIVSINLTLPEKTALSGVSVRLSELKENGSVYSFTHLTEPTISIKNVWNNNYRLEVYQGNCLAHVANLAINGLEHEFAVNFQKSLSAPVNLKAKSYGTESALMQWEKTTPSTIVYDDGEYETGFFTLPATYLELGNRYNLSNTAVLSDVKIYGMMHPWAIKDNPVYIKVYNQQKEFIGASEPFELPFDEWIDVKLPNIKVQGIHYIMVCWDYVYNPTNLLAIDINGNTAVNVGAAYVKNHFINLAEFGSVGGYRGAWIMHPEYFAVSGSTNPQPLMEFDNENMSNPIEKLVLFSAGEKGQVPAYSNTKRSMPEAFNVYVNNSDEPYKSNVFTPEVVLDNLKEMNYTFGVSLHNEWGESDIATISYQHKTPSANAALKSLTAGGKAIVGFSPEVSNYIVPVGMNTMDFPLIDAQAADLDAEIIIRGNGEQLVSIEVTAPDRIHQKVYSVYFARVSSNSDVISEGVYLYPNPAMKEVTLSCETNSTVYIYDLPGKLLHQFATQQLSTQIPLTNYKPGIYLVEVVGSNGKIVVSRLTIK